MIRVQSITFFGKQQLSSLLYIKDRKQTRLLHANFYLTDASRTIHKKTKVFVIQLKQNHYCRNILLCNGNIMQLRRGIIEILYKRRLEVNMCLSFSNDIHLCVIG